MSRARNRPLSVRRIPCRSRAILVRTDPLTHTLDDQVDCWECGNNCFDCIEKTQQACKRCLGGYCLIHNEGCTKTLVSTCGDRSFYLQAATDAEPQCDCKAATAGGCERPVRTNRSSQGAQAVDGEYENSTEGAKKRRRKPRRCRLGVGAWASGGARPGHGRASANEAQAAMTTDGMTTSSFCCAARMGGSFGIDIKIPIFACSFSSQTARQNLTNPRLPVSASPRRHAGVFPSATPVARPA